MMARMNLLAFRWTLPPVFVVAGLLMVFKGVTAAKLAACSVSALAWYAMSRRKARSLDRPVPKTRA